MRRAMHAAILNDVIYCIGYGQLVWDFIHSPCYKGLAFLQKHLAGYMTPFIISNFTELAHQVL